MALEASRKRSRILICDDRQEQYKMLADYLKKEGYDCDKRVSSLDELRKRIEATYETRTWYEFIMIDIDLRPGGEKRTGVECYLELKTQFPNETYIIYTSHDSAEVRREISKLIYRDVVLILLEQMLKREDLRFYLARVVQGIAGHRIFLVNGRNTRKASAIRTLLGDHFGLEVIEWEDADDRVPSARKTMFDIVLTGIEMSACTLVLFTDDEESELRPEFREPEDFTPVKGRRRVSRPNVYLEAGYAFGRRPGRTVFVEWHDRPDLFRMPSDFEGYHTVRFSDTKEGRAKLRRKLEGARCHLTLSSNWEDAPLQEEPRRSKTSSRRKTS